MFKYSMAFILVALLSMLSADAFAICNMTLKRVKDVRFRGTTAYDVYSLNDLAQTVYFSVIHKKSDACSYFVTFSKGGAGSYSRILSGPSANLGYQIYDTSVKTNILKEIPEAVANEVMSGTFGTAKETREVSYFVSIPAGQLVAANEYQDNLTLRLYEGTLSSYTERDSASFAIQTNVEKVVQMCVIGCGAPFDPFSKSRTMNFGQMQTGDTREVDLLVRGNVAYDVQFSSENRGVMKLTVAPNSTVPYTMTINGTPINLAATKVTVASGLGLTPIDGDRYHLNATIGSIVGAYAGNYRDNITITVRSL